MKGVCESTGYKAASISIQVPISQLTGAVILNPVPRPDAAAANAATPEVSFDDAQSRSPTAPNGSANGATSTVAAEGPLPNSEKLRLKSGRAALLAELPPPPAPPPPPPLPPTRRHCQKYYFGGGEGEMQKGKGFSTIGASLCLRKFFDSNRYDL